MSARTGQIDPTQENFVTICDDCARVIILSGYIVTSHLQLEQAVERYLAEETEISMLND